MEWLKEVRPGIHHSQRRPKRLFRGHGLSTLPASDRTDILFLSVLELGKHLKQHLAGLKSLITNAKTNEIRHPGAF